MASIRQITQTIADVRGMPFSNIDTYMRKLRAAGKFPASSKGRGGSSLTPHHAAMALLAVMRGSPVKAAENATELGELKPRSEGGAMTSPILDGKLEGVGWDKDTTLAMALADLIKRSSNGRLNEIFGLQPGAKPSGFTLQVDKYWTRASLYWHPSKSVIKRWNDSFTSLDDREEMKRAFGPDILRNGYVSAPMEIMFHTPLLREQEITYASGDTEGNRNASRLYRELQKERSAHDLHGTESISLKTIEALANLFEVENAD